MTPSNKRPNGGQMADTGRLGRLAEQLIEAVPKLDTDGQRVALALLRALSDGEPVSDQRVAEALRVSEITIRELVASWPGVFRDEDQRIIGFMGLAVGEFGEHRIDLDG